MGTFPNVKPTYVYYMPFDTIFHPLSFRLANIGLTKQRGLGYKQ